MKESPKAKRSYRFIVVLFALTMLINWLYLLYADRNIEFATQSWFYLFPFISLIYYTFSVLGGIGLYLRTRWGLGFVYVSILFATISCSISHILAYKIIPLSPTVLVFLLILNFLVAVYIAYHASFIAINED